MKRILLISTVAAALVGAQIAAGADDFVERMAREHADDSPSPSPAALQAPDVEIVASDLTYAYLGEDRSSIDGYLARPKEARSAPGLIVIHEWWGLNDNVKRMADRLAGQGYFALAVDLYEGDVATDRDEAMTLMRASTARPERLIENLRQARAKLAEFGATKVGTIGWCFGGGWSLRTALALGEEVDATVIYYGRVETTPEALEPLRAPILGHFGEIDRGIPIEQVRAFESALGDLGKEATIHVYSEADHAFANPSGSRYNAEAAESAWARTIAFFREHLDD